MKQILLLALAMVTVGFAGCTDGETDSGVPVEPYTGPKAELSEGDVYVSGFERDYVDCQTRTQLSVSFNSGVKGEGDFTVNVYSESAQKNNESSVPGIQVYAGTFSGADNGTHQEDISGSAGQWVLEVHRSTYHDGSFVVRLICA